MGRPVFALRVRAEPGADEIRSLRSWLKVGLRTFGLRCVPIEQVKEKGNTMDMKKYSEGGFIKADNVRDGPLQAVIVNVYISDQYKRPVLELDNGDQFTVNVTNNRALCKAYGTNSDDWRGHTVEFSLGHYKDWSADPPEEKETVLLKPVSLRDESNSGGLQRVDPATLPALKDNLSDEIPFVLAFLIISAVAWLVAGGGNTLIA